MRVSLTEVWEDTNGNTLSNTQNGNSAAILNLSNRTDWIKDGNYYYYNNNLMPNQSTNSFIESVTFNPAIVNSFTCTQSGSTRSCSSTESGYDSGTYTLTFTIETIQCDAAEDAWGLDPTELTLKATLLSGESFNKKLKSLSTGQNSEVMDTDVNTMAFLKSNNLPNGFVPTTDNIISTSANDYIAVGNNYSIPYENSLGCNADKDYYLLFSDVTATCVQSNDLDYPYNLIINGSVLPGKRFASQTECSNAILSEDLDPNQISCVHPDDYSDASVYAWYDSNEETIFYYSEADEIYLSADSSSMFYGFSGLSNISGLSDFDLSNVIIVASMFQDCTGLSSLQYLQNWDTSNIKNMSSMFYHCNSLTSLQYLANWDTSNVQMFTDMFSKCTSLNDASGINGWDISSGGEYSFRCMFLYCPSHPTFTNRAGTWSSGTFTPTS